MTAPTLPFQPETRADQIFRRFKEFHRLHPEVWRLFCGYADQVRTSRVEYSAYAVIQRVRWEIDLITDDAVKINNDFTPYFARMYNAVAGVEFFRLRRRFSGDRPAQADDHATHDFGPVGDEGALRDELRALAGVVDS